MAKLSTDINPANVSVGQTWKYVPKGRKDSEQFVQYVVEELRHDMAICTIVITCFDMDNPPGTQVPIPLTAFQNGDHWSLVKDIDWSLMKDFERPPSTAMPALSSDRKALVRQGVSLILQALDVSKDDRNFKDTPERVAKVYQELFWSGTPKFTCFPETHDQLIIIRDHICYTLCPHHLLPVRFTIHAGYIPDGQVLGASKIPRIFDLINRSPLMQETATEQFADTLFEHTGRLGCGVIFEGEHACMRMRGIRSHRAVMTTSAMRGRLMEDARARQEFLDLVVHSSRRQ